MWPIFTTTTTTTTTITTITTTTTTNKLWAAGRHDMPPPLSSPVGAKAPYAAEQTAT